MYSFVYSQLRGVDSMKKVLFIVGMFVLFISFFYIDSLAFSEGDIVYNEIKSYKYEPIYAGSVNPTVVGYRRNPDGEYITKYQELTFIKSRPHDNICLVQINSTGEKIYMKEVNLISELEYKEKLHVDAAQKVVDKYTTQVFSRYDEKQLKLASDECKAALKSVPPYLVHNEEAQKVSSKLEDLIDKIAEAARDKGMDVSEDGTINYELSEGDTTEEDSFQQSVDDLREEDLEDQVWGYDDIYYYPEVQVGDVGNDLDSTISNADDFVNNGNVDSVYDADDLQSFSSSMYNILLTVGIVVAVIVGAVIGIKLMSSGIETKVEAKKLLIPYVAGCIVVFGGFAIWKIVVTILQQV